MKPNPFSRYVASIVRAQAKSIEFQVPVEHHVQVPQAVIPERLFTPAIATLGDLAASIARHVSGASYELDSDERVDLLFHARILWMHAESLRCVDLNRRLNLLSSAAYYMAGMPGISKVLLDRYLADPEPDATAIERSLVWILSRPWSPTFPTEVFTSHICETVQLAIIGDLPHSSASKLLQQFRGDYYHYVSSEDLLFGDLFCAVARARLSNSSRKLLPELSGTDLDLWRPYLERSGSLPELWPSQQLLGRAGVYAGTSSVVQMPTSAGKTKAIELVIRSAFLSGRADFAVVVAPFRALCSEISSALREEFGPDGYLINKVSDVIQADFFEGMFDFLDLSEFSPDRTPAVLVVTPEKLLYILRNKPELASQIGLIVFDEGHQFDTGTRGVTYELLVTSIKALVDEHTQVVLISAVIQNPEALSEWLLHSATAVVRDSNSQTQRSIAYASWQDGLGFLSYSDPDADGEAFSVPRVLVSRRLALRGRESRPRMFPERGDSTSIALFLGATLVRNGAVAIFCGIKASVSKTLRDALDVFGREPGLSAPAFYCHQAELARLVKLYRQNFGPDIYLTQAAELGMFGHHADTPHGIRLAVEYAMRMGHIRFVACTSTLAQGVNLPIRYLLVTGTRQGTSRIRTRDFHNLMGRAGRAGIHGEGTVIFTDPKIFDGRRSAHESWRWSEVQSLLRPDKTEPTESTLLTLIAPIFNQDKTRFLGPTPIDFLIQIIRGREGILEWAKALPAELISIGFLSASVLSSVESRVEIISALESFLMSHAERTEGASMVASQLAAQTLAFSLADEAGKSALLRAFEAIAAHISDSVPDITVRRRFGRTLLGVNSSLSIEKWANENIEAIDAADSPLSMLGAMWPLLVSQVRNSRLTSSSPDGGVLLLAERWIEGDSFSSLFDLAKFLDLGYSHGTQFRNYKIDDLVGLCEQTFGFEIQLIVAALLESIQARGSEDSDAAVVHLTRLQKMLKYGLNSPNAIAFFEAGFSERVVASRLASRTTGQIASFDALKQLLSRNREFFERELETYPAFFASVMKSLIDS